MRKNTRPNCLTPQFLFFCTHVECRQGGDEFREFDMIVLVAIKQKENKKVGNRQKPLQIFFELRIEYGNNSFQKWVCSELWNFQKLVSGKSARTILVNRTKLFVQIAEVIFCD